MQTKLCRVCNEKKPVSDFGKTRFRKHGEARVGDGYRTYCRACHALRAHKRRAAMTAEDRLAASQKEAAWRSAHPHSLRARWANKHAKKVGAGGTLTESDVASAWDLRSGLCWVCGCPADSLDHYRPLNGRSGGTNTASNIRPICRECNQKRSHEWHGEETAIKEAQMLKDLKHMLDGSRTVHPLVGASGSPNPWSEKS